MLEEVINTFPSIFDKIINFDALNNAEIVILSIQIIIIAVLLLIIAVIIYFFLNRKSKEELHAKELLKKVNDIKKKKEIGEKVIDFNEQVEEKDKTLEKKEKEVIVKKEKKGFFNNIFKKKKSSIKDEKTVLTKVDEAKKENVGEKKEPTISLKDILIKKFTPKIEAQLKTNVNILDFKSKGSDFEALIEVEGTKLTIILDNSGKIIDYKK